MRKLEILGLAMTFMLIAMTGCTNETPGEIPEGTKDVEAVRYTSSTQTDPECVDRWRSGDAYFECGQAGSDCDFAWKLDAAAPNGMYSGLDADQMITIYDSDGKTFSWTSKYRVCAVIVKAGTGACIYRYPEGVCADEGLSAYMGKDISHVTFCYDKTPCDTPPEKCYDEETAWAAGPRYVKRGNWATYTPYTDAKVALYAGRNMLAGYLTFSDNGNGTVTIKITLTNGFIFYYDGADAMRDDNIKIQDYASKPPKRNPAPGRFDHKASADVGTTSYSIIVPKNNYYGIHLDVAREVDCK